MSFFHKLIGSSDFCFTIWSVSFLYLFLRALARTLGTFGVCGVEVFSRQLFRQESIRPGQNQLDPDNI